MPLCARYSPMPAAACRYRSMKTRRRTVLGDLGDSNIQRLLLAAARDESNPAVRVESMDALKDHAISDEVRNVLLYALSQRS